MRNTFNRFRAAISVLVMAVGLMLILTGCTNPIIRLLGADVSGRSDQNEIRVNKIEDMIDAIAPDKEIILKDNKYNMSAALKTLYGSNGNDFNKSHKYVKLEACDDGIQLIITNVKNLTIKGKGSDKTSVTNNASYADIFLFENCENVSLRDFAVCHDGPNDKVAGKGDVLEFKSCEGVWITGLEVSGANGYGIKLSGVSNFEYSDSSIHNCALGALSARNSSEVYFEKVEITDCKGDYTISPSGSSAIFKKCDFDRNIFAKDFCSQSEKNNIVFDECFFGIDEAIAVGYGTVSGTEGYSFNDACEYEQVLDGDIDIVPVESQDFEVDNVGDFLECIMPNAHITMAPGVYNISDYFYENSNIDEWNNKHPYVKVTPIQHEQYEVVFRDCDNLSITGVGEYHSPEVVIESSSTERSVLYFVDCNKVTINNVTIENAVMEDLTASAMCFSECSSFDFYSVVVRGPGAAGMSLSDCSGTWYFYDSDIGMCQRGPLECFDSEMGLNFYDCRFVGSREGFASYCDDVEMNFYGCHFGYAEWHDLIADDHVKVVDNCSHDTPSVESGFEDSENLVSMDIHTSVLCDKWYGIKLLRDNVIYELPMIDDNGRELYFEMEFYEDGSGIIYSNMLESNMIGFMWNSDDYDYMSYFTITYFDNDAYTYNDGEMWIFANDEDYYRMQVRIEDDYYLLY